MRFLAGWFLIVALGAARAGVMIEAEGQLPAEAVDGSGDTIGGIGSGMVYDAREDVFVCVSDRGPGDGKIAYRPRLVFLKVRQSGRRLEPELVGTAILRDKDGREMTGLIPDDREAGVPRMKDGRKCIDPEGVALAPDGTIYVSEEYGPAIFQFQRDGRMIRRIKLPEMFRPVTREGNPDFTDSARLVGGRNINQGPEGLCLLPGGKTAAVILQSGLVQFGGYRSPTTWLLLLDLETETPVAAYAYAFAKEVGDAPLELATLSANDLAVLSDTKFLVLERDKSGRTGSMQVEPARFKSVWLADTAGAGNYFENPGAEPVPVKKTLLFNLPELVEDPVALAAKWESIVVLPESNDKELTLLMAADNDFLVPVIHENGERHPFPRAEEAQATQLFKIRVPLPENP